MTTSLTWQTILEKLESGTIIGCVRGFGKNLGRVTPDMAITAYSSRLDLL